MQLISLIWELLLLPLILIRVILLLISILLAKTIPFLSVLTYTPLLIVNYILLILSLGGINNIAMDGRLIGQAMNN